MLKSSVLCKHFCVEKPSLNQPVCHKQLNLLGRFFKMELSRADPVRSKSSAAGPGLTGNGRGPTGCPATPHTTIGKCRVGNSLPLFPARRSQLQPTGTHPARDREGFALLLRQWPVNSEISFWAVSGHFLFVSQGIGDQTPSLCCEISSQVQLVAVSVTDTTAT